ncbi:major facilitator superfamily domain-containing protein, partial [Vararia minispora EC-137]
YSAALALFLATTDATIVSTSLPTISATFSATQTDYTWVGVAYMLTQTACQPLYGRLSDLIGRKTVLFASILVFAVGALLCGAARNITWLIIARGLSGAGGGGIVSCVWVITSEIVETERRAKWSQALSVTWSCSAVAGPLFGGLFSATSQASFLNWRWAFYLNLPVCAVASVVLALSLHGTEQEHSEDVSWSKFMNKFDFLGLLSFITGSSCIIVGFSFAASVGWVAASTLTLIVLGTVILVCAGIYETRTTREALFPPIAFKSVNVVLILFINFLHNFAFTSGTFYLARFYQVCPALYLVSGTRTILESSLMLLPYSLGSSLASMPAAWIIDYFQTKTKGLAGQRIIIASGLVVATTGFGLLELLHQGRSALYQAIIPLVAGIGLGMLFHAPYQVFAHTLPSELLATGTSAFFLVRFTGATVGLVRHLE